MLSVIKRALFSMLLLLVMPVGIWASGWGWAISAQTVYFKSLYWITETSSYPWAAITSCFIGIYFAWLLKLSKKSAIQLLIILAVTIIVGQALKSAVKKTVREPRPFVLWLKNEYHLDDKLFYQLPRRERSAQVQQQLANHNRVPSWLVSHWQNETGYAFPSGHALFSATWALLACLLLWPRKHYLSCVIIVIWSIIVMLSRLLLGMHWPVDLIVSIVIGGLITVIACYCIENRNILPRMR